MKFSIIPSVFCLLVFVASCKKDDEAPTKAQFFQCQGFEKPAHSSLRTDIKFSDLQVFNDGHILGYDDDANQYVLCDDNLNFVKELGFVKGLNTSALQDGSLLSTKLIFNSAEYYPASEVYGYRLISLTSDCYPTYAFGKDLWTGWKGESYSEILKHDRDRRLQFKLAVDGAVIHRNGFEQLVEKDGFIYFATHDVDSALVEFVEDENGLYLDTINISHRNATLNLFKMSYSGELMWKKSVSGVVGWQPSDGYGYFGASNSNFWVFIEGEIFQFDINGKLLNRTCNDREFSPLTSVDVGICGVLKDNGDVVYSRIDEGGRFNLSNESLSGFAVQGNQIYSKTIEGIYSLNVLTGTKVKVYDRNEGGWGSMPTIARGCDGSFYFPTSINAAEQYLVRITKDGKSSY